jgi:hypothetical protein
MTTVESARNSRRRFLKISVSSALGGVALAACSTLGLPKISKAQAAYEDRSTRREHCAGCIHFVAPHGCTVVAGDISRRGVCRYFSAKA